MFQGGFYYIFCDLVRTVFVGFSCVGRLILLVVFSNFIILMKGVGEGRIRAIWGWISVDRGSKVILLFIMFRRVFKSSVKDLVCRPLGREFRGG